LAAVGLGAWSDYTRPGTGELAQVMPGGWVRCVKHHGLGAAAYWLGRARYLGHKVGVRSIQRVRIAQRIRVAAHAAGAGVP
jgi:hypothetical protein